MRNIFESINFEQLNNRDFIHILPCIIVLERIFNFSALINNSFNTAINRLLASNNFYLKEETSENSYLKNVFKDEKIILIKKNQNLLKNYIKYVFLNYGNFNNITNNLSSSVFQNLETLLKKLIFLKDIITENADLNEIIFLITQNILHYNFALAEMDKLMKNTDKKMIIQKINNFALLFKDFLCSYLNYTKLTSFKQGNSVKNIDIILLNRFTYAIILLKKSEFEFQENNLLKNDNIYNASLKDFVVNYLFKNVFSKQSILSNFIVKADGVLNLVELDNLFDCKNFDSKISITELREYCTDRISIKDSEEILDFLKYAFDKYQITNINKV